MNTFGNIFTLTTFGESHGEAIGGVVDGMPAGIAIDVDFIQSELNRRRPGQSSITTSRQEGDVVELLSGVFEGRSTGCPIGFIVRNTNQHSQDYENMRQLYRPSHADYTYATKYGNRDHRGGGRSSARITRRQVVGTYHHQPCGSRPIGKTGTATTEYQCSGIHVAGGEHPTGQGLSEIRPVEDRDKYRTLPGSCKGR